MESVKTELDLSVKRSKAVIPAPEDCTPNLPTSLRLTSSVHKAKIPKPQVEPSYLLHFGLQNTNDLIQHLEDLGLDSDNEPTLQTEPEQSRSESENELPSQLYPSHNTLPPVTPSRAKSHFSLNRSVTSVESSSGMAIPTTLKAKKKAEAARKREMRAQLAEFNQRKISFAEEFLQHLDHAFDSQITRMTEETGGIKIIWTKNFRNTAGRATVRSERILRGEAGVEEPGKRRYLATIELSEKVLDSEDKILCTMTHEYCHLLDIMVTENRAKGTAQHGASFKHWGDRCVNALKGHPIYGGRVEVTTKHTYEINHKYIWACKGKDCDFKVGRHSKSVDPKRQFCGRCRGVLEQIKPVPRAVVSRAVAPRRSVVKSMVAGEEKEIMILDP
ncbi:HMG box-containing protein C19G7.04 [Penicillium digitatum Pd1]|nr:HMG box-containing protein C19G7.04 [Penicillium digitatum Pd1]EKV14484.1 HMG box-containing protein C19G7.04 [Penicillium digitatum Pd1]